MTTRMFKYPRTRHIEGSRCQPGDEDLESERFAVLKDCHVVVEEKVDGANAGISFDRDGTLKLQSRGHYLTGGAREKHFTLFKQWAQTYAVDFFERVGDRYIIFGEWLYAKHTMFYNQLPHYFMEFDIFDTETSTFLDTPSRAELLKGLPIFSVRVLHSGRIRTHAELTGMIGPSAFISEGHLDELKSACVSRGLNVDRAMKETDPETTMEGLYIKVERDGIVAERYKYVRASFLTAVTQADGHWLSRAIIPNRLRSAPAIPKATSNDDTE